jgi:hypothetical protein
VCHAHLSETPISKRGYCQEHGRALLVANNDQLERKSGPFYDHWERRSLLWARRLLVQRQARLDNAEAKG